MVYARVPRISVNIEAEVISGTVRCNARIENLSDEGILARVVSPGEKYLSRGDLLDIEFKIPSGDMLSLRCKIMRVVIDSADERNQIVGLKIIERPNLYNDFYHSLSMNDMGIL